MKKVAAQTNLSIPAAQTYRHHLIVFSVVGIQKHVTVYRGAPVTSRKVLERSFSLSGWDGIAAWAQELIDDIWDWYSEHVDNERDPSWRDE